MSDKIKQLTLKQPSFAVINWDENGQPFSNSFDDVYFSKHNGLDETRYVFIQHNHLEERWKDFDNKSTDNNSHSHNNEFVIGETGFGTGLNFLATWQLWDKINKENLANDPTKIKKRKTLHFISIEKYPLLKKDLRRSLSLWPELTEYSEKLVSAYDDYPSLGFKQFTLSDSVKLTLIINDAAVGFNQLLESDHPWFRQPINQAHGVDAWFLDGFSPSKNPDMWSPELFNILAELSHPETTLATFTAAGFVKRGLKSVGFSIKKEKGFANKREMITGAFTIASVEARQNNRPDYKKNAFTSPYPVPWNINKQASNTQKNATVIGAGLAGCHTAYALAKKGWKVSIIDAADQPGSGASGNPQGIIYGKLSKDTDWLAQLNIASIPFAEQFYQTFWELTEDRGNAVTKEIGQQCGLLQLAHNKKEFTVFEQLKAFYEDGTDKKTIRENIQFLTAKEASNIAGITLQVPAIYFPKLGWLDPRMLCRSLLNHENIVFIGNTKISELRHIDNTGEDKKLWEVVDEFNKIIITTANVVIATASNAKQFSQTKTTPLKDIRGQISQIDTLDHALNIKTVLCGDGYIAPPAANGKLTLGATFTLHNNDPSITSVDNDKNLSSMMESIPSLANVLGKIKADDIEGRTGFRCTTPDFLPVVGPVHNHQEFLEEYSLLKKNANASIPVAGSYYNNLFVNVGYGSRGLAYSPLCSEFLAAKMNGDIWPISRSLAMALHPGRFTIRDLIRNKL